MSHIIQGLHQFPALLLRDRIKPYRIRQALYIVDHGAETDIFCLMFLISPFLTAAHEKNSEIICQETSPAGQFFFSVIRILHERRHIGIFRS